MTNSSWNKHCYKYGAARPPAPAPGFTLPAQGAWARGPPAAAAAKQPAKPKQTLLAEDQLARLFQMSDNDFE
eukprot:8544478-Pyramimonas_sp.AAC.1